MTVTVAHLTTVDMSVRHLLLNQILELKEAGFEVTAVSADGPDITAVRAAGVAHVPVSFTRQTSPIADVKSLWQLWRLFRRCQFTIVHTHQAKAALLGQLAATLSGVPIVVNTLHGFYFHERTPPLKRRLWMAIERLQATFSDAILSQNPEDIATAIAERICRPDQIEYLGNGIDLARFDPDALPPDSRSRTRESLGIAGDAKVVGFVGRLVREKGILDLFRAFSQVSQTIPGATLLIVGPEDLVKSDAVSARTASDYGIAGKTVFVGYRHDMPALYAAMDVCVLPSHREGFPRSPMEASAMGVPCVVTNIRGCRQVVRAEENGLLVPVGDADAMAVAISRILAEPLLADRMGAAGHSLARCEFNERDVFARVMATYRRLLSAKGVVAEYRSASESTSGP